VSAERRTPRETDLARVRTVPIAGRPNKVRSEDFAAAPGDDRSFAAFLRALPDVLKARDLPWCAPPPESAASS
jgi:hypothetical protein